MRTFVEYQVEAYRTALPTAKNSTYMALKLASEAGEVAGKVGKMLRGDGQLTDSDIAKELGDVLWYVAGMATVFGLSLEQIAADNITKLQSRQERGVIKGSGDNR